MDSLEKIYKEKLQDIEIQTSDKVWTNVSKALIRQRRIKRFLIYFFVATGIALILGLGIYLTRSNSKTKDQSGKNSRVIAEISDNINTNTNQANNSISSNENSQKLNIQKVNSESDINNVADFPTIPNNASIVYQTSKKHIKPTLKNIEYIVQNGSLQDQSMDKPITLANINESKEFINISRLISIKPLSILKYSGSGIETFKFKIIPQGILNDCFPSRVNKWFMDLYLSPDYAKKSLTGPKQDYIDSRISSESALLSYSGGVMAGYKINDNFLIKGGMNFTRINEKFHIVIKDVKNTQTVITIDTVWNSDGTYNITRDTTIKEIYGKEDIQKINKYSMIDIPVIFGYQFKHNDLNLGINAGVILNILSFQEGKMLNMSGEVETFDGHSDNPDIFNKNLGVSIYTSAYLGYRINDNLEIFAEPKFRYFLKPFTNTNYPLTQKYSKFGISMGPRYFFN